MQGHVHISTAPHRWQAQRLSSDRSFKLAPMNNLAHDIRETVINLATVAFAFLSPTGSMRSSKPGGAGRAGGAGSWQFWRSSSPSSYNEIERWIDKLPASTELDDD